MLILSKINLNKIKIKLKNYSILYILVGILSFSSVLFIIRIKDNTHIDIDIFDQNLKIEQNDTNTVEYIRKHHLFSPPPSSNENEASIPLPLSNPSQYSSILQELFGQQFGGFFIECGANDGEFFSNTLYLEKTQGWTGILIEADRLIFPKLLSKKRRAWLSNVCLARERPVKMEMLHHLVVNEWNVGNNRLKILGDSGGFDFNYKSNPDDGSMRDMINLGPVECFPLYSILLAVPQLQVDFFSLDTDGYEFEVIQGIPFDLVKIRVLAIEHWFVPEGKGAIIDFMVGKNYELKYETEHDVIFVLKE